MIGKVRSYQIPCVLRVPYSPPLQCQFRKYCRHEQPNESLNRMQRWRRKVKKMCYDKVRFVYILSASYLT